MINLKFPCDQSHQKCNSFDKKTSVISNKHTRRMWFQRGRSHQLLRQFIVELLRMSQNQSQISIQEQQIKNWPKMGGKKWRHTRGSSFEGNNDIPQQMWGTFFNHYRCFCHPSCLQGFFELCSLYLYLCHADGFPADHLLKTHTTNMFNTCMFLIFN